MESCSESGKPGKQRLPAECFYVIRELDDGGKTIDCILKYDNKMIIKSALIQICAVSFLWENIMEYRKRFSWTLVGW